jgi:hypothetical protein
VVTGRSLNNGILVEIAQEPGRAGRAGSGAGPTEERRRVGQERRSSGPEAKNSYAVGVEMGAKLRRTALDLDAALVSRG